MLIGFFVRCEKGGVEDIVDSPRDREFELISDVRYLGDYLKGSVSPWGELCSDGGRESKVRSL